MIFPAPTRASAGSGRLNGIEAGRGIAAASVALYHISRHLDKAVGAPRLRSFFQFGHSGVDFFFVISGFIILFVHRDDIGVPRRFPRYIGRRATRLMPLYWVALAATLTQLVLGSHALPDTSTMLVSLTLLPANLAPVVDVAWTLQFEMLFYLVFAMLILQRTSGRALLLAWFGLTAAAFAGYAPLRGVLPGQFNDAFNLGFFLGMAGCLALPALAGRHALPILVLGVTLFALAAAAEDIGYLDGYGHLARALYQVPAAMIVPGLAAAERARKLPIPALLRRLGAASYSIYLFHFLLIGIAWRVMVAVGLDRMLPVAALFALLALAALGGGVLISTWIEYPLINAVRTGRLTGPLASGLNRAVVTLGNFARAPK